MSVWQSGRLSLAAMTSPYFWSMGDTCICQCTCAHADHVWVASIHGLDWVGSSSKIFLKIVHNIDVTDIRSRQSGRSQASMMGMGDGMIIVTTGD